jgi:uncharacterized protein YkwD
MHLSRSGTGGETVMLGFFYAFCIGGLALLVGGSSSSSSSGGGSLAPANNALEPEPVAPEPAQAETPPGSVVSMDDDSGDVTDDDSADGIGGSGAPSGGGLASGGDAVADSDGVGGTGAPDLPNSAYDIGWAGLTAEEQMVVELVNRARMDPLEEVDRLDEGLASGIPNAAVQPLAVTSALSEASRDHSEDMDNRDFFSHTNPDNDGPGARAFEAGHGSGFVGENIGWIGSSRAPDAQARAEAHHENLWESDGHQVNLMRDFWTEIGVGYDYGDYRGLDHSTFVTEMFSDRGETYLTGVVIDDEDGDEFYDVGEGQGDVRITAFDGDDAYATATWDAGGYSLALPPGTYRVVFEGGDLDQPYETDVTIGNENVKLDVIEENGGVVASLNAGMPLPGVAVEEIATLAYVDGVEDEEDIFDMI